MKLMWNKLQALIICLKLYFYPYSYKCGDCKYKHKCWRYVDDIAKKYPACKNFKKE